MERLNRHLEDCSELSKHVGGGVIKELPHCSECTDFSTTCQNCRIRATCKFKNFQNKIPIPMYMVADFESLLVGDPAEHKAMAYGIYGVVSSEYKDIRRFDRFKKMEIKFSQGDDRQLGADFVARVLEIGEDMLETIQEDQVWQTVWKDDAEKEAHANANSCHICGKTFHQSDRGELKKQKKKKKKEKNIGVSFRCQSGRSLSYNRFVSWSSTSRL